LHYRVEAYLIDPLTGEIRPGTGTLTTRAATKKLAIKSAASLKAKGYAVKIIGPDGKTLDEASAE